MFDIPVLHTGRSSRHTGHGNTSQVGTLAQFEYLRHRHVAFNELAVDHTGVTGRQTRLDSQVLLYRTHVAFNMVADLKAVVFQIGDPVVAATTVGVSVYIDDQGFSGMDRPTYQQRRKD